MKLTSAQANKLLKKLNSEYEAVRQDELKRYRFVAAISEDVESVRPAYDFEETLRKKEELLEKIRKLKHSINIFNTTTLIPGFNITVDEALVYLPQLNLLVNRLDEMRSHLPKERASGGYSGSMLIEYEYTNYDISKAETEYLNAFETLTKLQLALDGINSTVEFDVNI